MYMVCYGGMYMKCLVLTRRKMLTICACFVVCGLAVVFSVKGIQAVQTAYVQKVPIYSVPTPDNKKFHKNIKWKQPFLLQVYGQKNIQMQ